VPILGTGKKRFLTSDRQREKNREWKALQKVKNEAHPVPILGTGTSPHPVLSSSPQDGDICSQVKESSKSFVVESGTKANPEEANPTSFSSDLTVTLGGQIRTNVGLEELVTQISDGEFDTDTLDPDKSKGYEYRDELREACLAAIAAKANRHLDRKCLRDVMDYAMQVLKKKHDLNTPRGWLPVMKTLKQGGTCCTLVSRMDTPEQLGPPKDLWNDGASSLRCYVQELAPYREMLDHAAEVLPIPSGWIDAVEFLNAVIKTQSSPPEGLIQVRDAIRERIPTLVQQPSTSAELCSTGVQ
jgi:hypothetical protein